MALVSPTFPSLPNYHLHRRHHLSLSPLRLSRPLSSALSARHFRCRRRTHLYSVQEPKSNNPIDGDPNPQTVEETLEEVKDRDQDQQSSPQSKSENPNPGPSAIKEERDDLLGGVSEEIREIEWPVFGRVLGTTGVVLAVIAGSSVVLLTVNAVLAELSDRVFSGQGVQDFFS